MKSIAILAVASVAAMASAQGSYSSGQPAYSGGYYPNNQYCQVKVCTNSQCTADFECTSDFELTSLVVP